MSIYRNRVIDELRVFVQDILERRENLTSDDYEIEYGMEADEITKIHQWNNIDEHMPTPDLVDSKGEMKLYLCEYCSVSPFSEDGHKWFQLSGYVTRNGKVNWSSGVARRDTVRWMALPEYEADRRWNEEGNEIDEDGNIILPEVPEIPEVPEVKETSDEVV
jgi:hypothetical protein